MSRLVFTTHNVRHSVCLVFVVMSDEPGVGCVNDMFGGLGCVL